MMKQNTKNITGDAALTPVKKDGKTRKYHRLQMAQMKNQRFKEMMQIRAQNQSLKQNRLHQDLMQEVTTRGYWVPHTFASDRMVFSAKRTGYNRQGFPLYEDVACPRCLQRVPLEKFDEHIAQHSHEILPWGKIVERPLPPNMICEDQPGLVDSKPRIMDRTAFANLYVGSRCNAENGRELVIRTRTTHVLYVGDEPLNSMPEEAEIMGVKLHNIHFPDTSGGEAQSRLQRCLKSSVNWIRRVTKENSQHVVLVACASGARFAPAVVMAYLIEHENMSLNEAYCYVRARHPATQIAPALMQELGTLEMAKNPSLTSPTMRVGKDGRVGNIFLCEAQKVEPTFLRRIVHAENLERGTFYTDKTILNDDIPKEVDPNGDTRFRPTFIIKLQPNFEQRQTNSTPMHEDIEVDAELNIPRSNSKRKIQPMFEDATIKRAKTSESLFAEQRPTFIRAVEFGDSSSPSGHDRTLHGAGPDRRDGWTPSFIRTIGFGDEHSAPYDEPIWEWEQAPKRTLPVSYYSGFSAPAEPVVTTPAEEIAAGQVEKPANVDSLAVTADSLSFGKAQLKQVGWTKYGMDHEETSRKVTCPKCGVEVDELLFDEHVQQHPADIWPRQAIPAPYPSGYGAGFWDGQSTNAWLTLGSFSNARNPKDLISRYGTTHILNTSPEELSMLFKGYDGNPEIVTSKLPNRMNRSLPVQSLLTQDVGGVEMKHICCVDDEMDTAAIVRQLRAAANYIENTRNNTPYARIMVCDVLGVRSAAVVCISYLMIKQNFSLLSAFTHVRMHRNAIQPNEQLWKALASLELELFPGLDSPTMQATKIGRPGVIHLCQAQRVEPTFIRKIVHGDRNMETFHVANKNLHDFEKLTPTAEQKAKKDEPKMKPTFIRTMTETKAKIAMWEEMAAKNQKNNNFPKAFKPINTVIRG